MNKTFTKTIDIPISSLPSSFNCSQTISQQGEPERLTRGAEWWTSVQKYLFENDSMTQTTFISGAGLYQLPSIKRSISKKDKLRSKQKKK
jgi:hypothetical protein